MQNKDKHQQSEKDINNDTTKVLGYKMLKMKEQHSRITSEMNSFNNNTFVQLPNSFNDKLDQKSLTNLDQKSANSMQKYLNFGMNVAAKKESNKQIIVSKLNS